MLVSRAKTTRMLLLLACIASGDAMACNLENAIYRPKESPKEASLSFEKSAKPNLFSDLIATVRSGSTGRSYPLSFVVSNGYPTTSLVTAASGDEKSKKDVPYSSIGTTIYFFDEQLNGAFASMADEKAPPYLFLPELGLSLYYGGDATIKDREIIPTEMWVLSECR